jgi:hypothetical protein
LRAVARGATDDPPEPFRHAGSHLRMEIQGDNGWGLSTSLRRPRFAYNGTVLCGQAGILHDVARVLEVPGGAERNERRSAFITSNRIFAHWNRIFRDQMATAAAIDRMVHHSVLLEFDVPSFRTEQAKRRGKPTPRQATESTP